MRILHVIRSLDPHCGGPPAVLRSLVPRQVALGHDVTLLATSRQASGQAAHWSQADFVGAMRGDPAFAGTEISLLDAFGKKKPWSTFAYSPGCRRWLRQRLTDPARRPDVVHIHEVFVHLNMAAGAEARRHSIPYLIAPYGCLDAGPLDMGAARLKAAFSRLVVQKIVRHAAFVQATSHFEVDQLPSWIPRDMVRLVPHGVEMPTHDSQTAREAFRARFPETQGRRLIASMARLNPIKRLHLAIEAVARLRDSHPDLLLVIAGRDAGALPLLRDTVARLGIADSVLFPGFVDGEIREGMLAASELFILPSSHENFGLVVVEAMAHGLPAVVTPEVASHVYVDESGCGMTVPASPEKLADAIQDILGNKDQAWNKRARDYVRKNLLWETVAKQIDSLYNDAITRPAT